MPLRIFGESAYVAISIAFYDNRRADVPWQGLTSEEIMRNLAEPLNADENQEVERVRRLFPEARVYGIIAPESERPTRP
jgi:hypothetical protein